RHSTRPEEQDRDLSSPAARNLYCLGSNLAGPSHPRAIAKNEWPRIHTNEHESYRCFTQMNADGLEAIAVSASPHNGKTPPHCKWNSDKGPEAVQAVNQPRVDN